MHLLLLSALAVAFMVCYYTFNKPMLPAICTGMMWFLAGVEMYTQADATNDIYYLGGIFIVFVSMLYWWEAYTSYITGRKEEREENIADSIDELIDEWEDAMEQEDYALASRIKGQMAKVKERDAMLSIKTDTFRERINGKRKQRYWKKFDNEGEL